MGSGGGQPGPEAQASIHAQIPAAAMLLPYASDRPPRNPPLAVVSLVLLHFALFGLVALVATLQGPEWPVLWYASLSLVPAMLRPWSLVTYSLLHEDVLHLSVNMLFLWVFGGSVEDALGWRRFLRLYAAAVVLTGLLQAGMALALGGPARLIPIVGASGAVSALVGVFAVRFYRSRIRFIGLPVRVPALALLAAAMAVEMCAAIWHFASSGLAWQNQTVAHWSHIGGFALGVLWAQASRMMRAGRIEYLAADAAAELERGSPVAAAHRWEAVLAQQPDSLEARVALCHAWMLAGDAEQAARACEMAIPGLVKGGRRGEAARLYLDLQESAPGTVLAPAVQLSAAAALEEAGHCAQAARACQSLLKAHPRSAEAEMALLRLGILRLTRLGDPAGAARALREFTQRHPASDWRAYAAEQLRIAESRSAPSRGAGDSPPGSADAV